MFVNQQEIEELIRRARDEFGGRSATEELCKILIAIDKAEISNWIESTYSDNEVAYLFSHYEEALSTFLDRDGLVALVKKMTEDVRNLIATGYDFEKFSPEYTVSEMDRTLDMLRFEANCKHQAGSSLLVDWKLFWSEYPSVDDIVRLALLE